MCLAENWTIYIRTIRSAKLTLQIAFEFERARKMLVESILDNKLSAYRCILEFLVEVLASVTNTYVSSQHLSNMWDTNYKQCKKGRKILDYGFPSYPKNKDPPLQCIGEIIDDARVFKQHGGPLQLGKNGRADMTVGDEVESGEAWLMRLLCKNFRHYLSPNFRQQQRHTSMNLCRVMRKKTLSRRDSGRLLFEHSEKCG